MPIIATRKHGGNRAAAARKVAQDPLFDTVPAVAAAWRLFRAWFEDSRDTMTAVLEDIERQGLLVDAVIGVNGMLVAAMVAYITATAAPPPRERPTCSRGRLTGQCLHT